MSSISSISLSPFTATAEGVRVRVRATPRASADRIAGIVPETDGGVALKVTVTAVAEGGKANAAVLALLAREWGLARRDLSIAAGSKNRRKTVVVAGDPGRVLPLLERDLAARQG